MSGIQKMSCAYCYNVFGKNAKLQRFLTVDSVTEYFGYVRIFNRHITAKHANERILKICQ